MFTFYFIVYPFVYFYILLFTCCLPVVYLHLFFLNFFTCLHFFGLQYCLLVYILLFTCCLLVCLFTIVVGFCLLFIVYMFFTCCLLVVYCSYGSWALDS